MSRPPRTRRARASLAGRSPAVAGWRRSWQALLIVLGLMLAQGSTLLHLALVRHVTCEHGDLVEVGSRDAAPPRASREISSIDEGDRSPGAEPGDGSDGEHDHCDALGVRHRPTELSVHVPEAIVVDIDAPRALSPGDEERPVSILALAPKSSPPSA